MTSTFEADMDLFVPKQQLDPKRNPLFLVRQHITWQSVVTPRQLTKDQGVSSLITTEIFSAEVVGGGV